VTSYDLVAVICHHGTAGGTVYLSVYTSVFMYFILPLLLIVTLYVKQVLYYEVGVKGALPLTSDQSLPFYCCYVVVINDVLTVIVAHFWISLPLDIILLSLPAVFK